MTPVWRAGALSRESADLSAEARPGESTAAGARSVPAEFRGGRDRPRDVDRARAGRQPRPRHGAAREISVVA